jgi:hypothetical protein
MRKDFSPNIVHVPSEDNISVKAEKISKEDKIRECISNIGA